MAVTDDRKFTKAQVLEKLTGAIGKTLGEVDSSKQFDRTIGKSKITGIAGDVIEQSVFGYKKDANQECDIEIDGLLTELKTTGVRIPKRELKKVQGKDGASYNSHLGAKEGISITGVTLTPSIQLDFATSHFWEKSERLLIVFYEYNSYKSVPASDYANFRIVDYCYNTFSDEDRNKLCNDWEIVRNYLQPIYNAYKNENDRNAKLIGFTHTLRPQLLFIELVPSFKKLESGSYQKPRYRLKKSFVDYIVKGHFQGTRKHWEIDLKDTNRKYKIVKEQGLRKPFGSFEELDARCHSLNEMYKGHTLAQLKDELKIGTALSTKDFTSKCILKMFDADCNRLNNISEFVKAGIVCKTITITPDGKRTEDMKLQHIDFDEWTQTDIEFSESELFMYFWEHSFLCPVFCERGDMAKKRKGETSEQYKERIAKETQKTTFEGFKRFFFDEEFIENDVKNTWDKSRELIRENKLVWEYELDKLGNMKKNKSGSYKGAPNFPKSQNFNVFFRGGNNDSREEARTEIVNNVHMLPQFFWLKGSFIAEKLKTIEYL